MITKLKIKMRCAMVLALMELLNSEKLDRLFTNCAGKLNFLYFVKLSVSYKVLVC